MSVSLKYKHLCFVMYKKSDEELNYDDSCKFHEYDIEFVWWIQIFDINDHYFFFIYTVSFKIVVHKTYYICTICINYKIFFFKSSFKYY